MTETHAFWLLLLAFAFADNLHWLPAGGDLLSLNRHGRPRYAHRRRHLATGRDVLFTNPFNLLDRVVHARLVTESEVPTAYRRELAAAAKLARATVPLAWLGWAYAAFLALACWASLAVSFGAVVLPLLAGHLAFWLAAALLTWRLFKRAGLGASHVAKRAVWVLVEALFVPAYVINLSRKLLLLQPASLSSLRMHLRGLPKLRARDAPAAELRRYELAQTLSTELDRETAAGLHHTLEEWQTCLKN